MRDLPSLLQPAEISTQQLYKSYAESGFVMTAIRPMSKSPMGDNWNKVENCFSFFQPPPEFVGVGLCHAYSGTVAIDIDHWARASIEFFGTGIDLNTLYDAPDAVIIDSGREGHGKLLYKLPPGMVLKSKKLIDKDEHGNRYNYIDFRCATADGLTVQDVLPSPIGLHPDTGKPYKWAGKGHYTRIPQIPFLLLMFWQSLLAKDSERKIDMGGPISASWDEIQSALNHISPDVSRMEWVSVGMALRYAGEQTDQEEQALTMWNEWSAKGTKYQGEREIMSQWSSFKNDKGSLVKLGTLYHLAKEAGWQKPQPDITELFKSIPQAEEPTPPDVVSESLKPKPPNVDLSLFPKVLATRAQEVSQSVGCDPLVPLWAGLSAACAVADAQSRLYLNESFAVPPVLWMMTIGDPSDKKSPGSRPMLSVLEEIEKEDVPRFMNRKLEWEGREAAHASAHKAFIAHHADVMSVLSNSVVPSVPDLPPPPEPLKIVVSDVTSQRLIRRAAANPRGLLCYLDEMNSWVRKVTDKGTGEDRSAWVSGYEAQRYEMDRVGSGHIVAENYALSIYGNIQPQVLKHNLDALASDGLLQRFIPAILRNEKTGIGFPLPDFMTTKHQWEQSLRLISILPTQKLQLEPEAYSVFRKFQYWYEETKKDYRKIGVTNDFMTAFGKLEGNVGRLCMIWHMLENPMCNVVDVSVVERVIRFVKEYLIPAYNFTLGDQAGADGMDQWLVEKVVEWSGERPTVTLSDIKRMARRKLENMPMWQSDRLVTDSMEALTACGWVAIIEEDTHKKQITWMINDKIAVNFKAHKDRIKEARMRLLGTVVSGPSDAGDTS